MQVLHKHDERFHRAPALLAALVCTVCCAPAAAGDPLFESDDVLEVRVSGPLRSLARDLGSEPEERPGTLWYAGADGAGHTFAVGLRPRGHFRRRKDVCTVPPLRVNVRRKEVAGTLFDGQDKLKLVAHCRSSVRHDRHVYKEYLAYRMLNRITDASFRVRGLDIEWVDEDRGGRTERRFGFFIEDDDRLAARLGLEVAEPGIIDRRRLAAEHAGLMALFQFMIGNTDFSFIAPRAGDRCCHNVTLLTDAEGRYWPMPYDFDISGFVDPPYAVVDGQLPIRDVSQRLYRGFCHDPAAQARAVARFREARADITALLDAAVPLADRDRRQARRYVDAFYAVIEDPRDLEREVLGACRS